MAQSNDYRKDEDFALWQLHEIRHEMAAKPIDIEQVNQNARKVMAEFGIVSTKVAKPAAT